MRTLLLLSSAMSAAMVAGAASAQSTPQTEPTSVDPITVIATRTATPVDEVPATVSVITADQIEAMLATDIKDLIRYEPGVSVVSQPQRFGAALGVTGRAGNAGFTIRGMGGDRVLQIVDGVRQPDGFVFGAQSVGRGGYSDLDVIESVEILRGPASALYGSDGISGAVSFTTRDPASLMREGRDFGIRARVGYHSADEGMTESLALAGRSGAFSGLVAYTRRDSQETETHGDATGENLQTVTIGVPGTPSFYSGPGYNYGSRTLANPQDIQSDALLAKLVWYFAPNHSLRLTYDGYQMDSDAVVLSGRTTRPEGPTPPLAATAVLNLAAADSTERQRVSLDWRFEDVAGFDGHTAVYWQDATSTQFTAEDRVGVDRTRLNTFDNQVWGVAADARRVFSIGGTEHRVTFGGDYSSTRQEGIRDGTVPPAGETFPTRAFPNTDYYLAGLFIQDEISLLDGRLTITPALRYDAYGLDPEDDAAFPGSDVSDQDDSRLSPKLGVMFWGDDHFGLFANYSEGFKAPTPMQVNNFFANPAFGYISEPNPDLGPETSRSIEGGLRFRDLEIFGGQWSIQTTAFATSFDGFISQQVVSGSFTPADPAVYKYVNFAEVDIRGIEGRIQGWWDNGVRLNAAASFASGDVRDTVDADLASIDPIKVVAGVGYDHPSGRFGGEAIVTWSAEKDGDLRSLGCGTTCYTGDSFALLDLTGYWNVTDMVTARAGVFNVFDEKYGWWSDFAGVSAASTVTDAYTQPGRNFGVSLALRY